jgi:hypothetical protein
MAISQREAGHLIRQRKTFRTGNVFAEISNGLYAAYSYGYHFPLAVFCPEEGWLVNSDSYSPSTTIQQSKTSVSSLPGSQYRSSSELRARIEHGDAAYRDAQTVVRVTNRITEKAYA